MHGIGVLDKISTSGFSCRRPFKCTRAIKLSLTPSLFHVRSCMTSTRALGMSFASAIKIFLHPTCFSPCKFCFQNVLDLAFVKSHIRGSTITSHYATSHVSSGLISVCISITVNGAIH